MRDANGQNVDFFQMEGNTENRERLGLGEVRLRRPPKKTEKTWSFSFC